jgi:predicted enzyme related to lactoylglutathione lyase
MSNETPPPQLRRIAWHDLTVANADQVRDFYAEVVGWKPQGLSMGDYDDYCMNDPVDGETVAGICHARGPNANIPAQWLIYITVPSVAAAIAKCEALGGAVIEGPRPVGGKSFCIIRDPAGAVAALIEP